MQSEKSFACFHCCPPQIFLLSENLWYYVLTKLYSRDHYITVKVLCLVLTILLPLGQTGAWGFRFNRWVQNIENLKPTLENSKWGAFSLGKSTDLIRTPITSNEKDINENESDEVFDWAALRGLWINQSMHNCWIWNGSVWSQHLRVFTVNEHRTKPEMNWKELSWGRVMKNCHNEKDKRKEGKRIERKDEAGKVLEGGVRKWVERREEAK